MSWKLAWAPEWCEADSADVPNPSAGSFRLYRRDDGHWYERQPSGDEARVFPNTQDTVDPSTGDDSASGYPVGHIWVNTTNDTAFVLVDGSTGAAVWANITAGLASHENLDTLVHRLAETHFVEVIRSAGRVTDVIAWTNNLKTTKVREVNLTRVSGKVVSYVEKQYDSGGSVVTGQTLTGTITRSAGKVQDITVVET